MTIELFVKYKDPKREIEGGPIATNKEFEECWLPACERLHLQWISLFLTGYPAIDLNLNTIPEVIDELQRLRVYFAENSDQLTSSCVAELIIGRIELRTLEIRHAIDIWDEIEYVHV